MRDFATDCGLSAASIARVGDTLSCIFGFTVHEDRIEANPVRGLAHPLTPVSCCERRFEDDALAKLWDVQVLHSTPRIAVGETVLLLFQAPQKEADPRFPIGLVTFECGLSPPKAL